MARFGVNFSRGARTVTQSSGGVVGVRFSGVDLADYGTRLDGIARRGQNLQPAMDAWGRHIVEHHIPEQFAAQGTPKKWRALSPRYAAWKQKRYGNLPILVITGRMRGGFRWKATARTLQIVNQAKAKGKGGKPYWQYHQSGTSRMPARELLQTREEDKVELQNTIWSYLLTQTTGVGL